MEFLINLVIVILSIVISAVLTMGMETKNPLEKPLFFMVFVLFIFVMCYMVAISIMFGPYITPP